MWSRLAKKLAVRTQTDELQNLSIRLAIDQQQIGLKGALSMVAPVPPSA
jgi:hypothetical protein